MRCHGATPTHGRTHSHMRDAHVSPINETVETGTLRVDRPTTGTTAAVFDSFSCS